MSKEEDLVRRCINCSALVNQQTPRYWVVYRIKYDFESGGWYSVKDLSKTDELKRYGTYEGAKKYALNLYHKYKKELGEDLEVCINEELIDLNENKKLNNKIADLEAKLAEKDLRIEELESQFAYECECNKQFVECQNENEKLKQQLAEKEIDLSLARNEINTLKHNLNISQEHDNVMCEQYFKKCKETNQDKISFAVEQLEKVKELALIDVVDYGDDFGDTWIFQQEFIDKIDNEIKQLKEMN